MSFGSYLAGAVEMLVVIAALGYGAVRLRARLLDGWSGARARLAEIVLGLSLLVVSLELIGVVGLYKPGWVLIGTVAGGVGAGLWASRGEGRSLADLPTRPIAPLATFVAIGAAMLVAAHWAMPTQTGLDIGMYLPNTTWHNAPFAARFVQDAQVGALHMTEVLKLTVWFYPQNSELLHSFGILFLDSDFLSPLINIGWMCLCLLAAWSFGRPYGAAATALLGLAILLDAEMLLLYQPGDAKNDVGGLFFLIASAAILVNGEAQARAGTQAARTLTSAAEPLKPLFPRGALIVAGLAAGLALGTKLNLLAPFGLLTLGVIAVARPGDRLRTAGVWVAASLATGGFWFARNLVEAGNPLPWANAGPLPGPDRPDIEIRAPGTVSDYLTNGGVITDTFIPRLNDSFGVLWPVVIAAVVVGFGLAIWRGTSSMIRMLGVVALLSGVAYLFTPLTAAGPPGEPSAFEVNLRYASPCLALGILLLAIDPALRRGRAQQALLGGLSVLLAVGLFSGSESVWDRDFLFGAAILVVLLIVIPAGLALAPRAGFSRRAVAAGAAAAIALTVGIGWAKGDSYQDDRYRAETAPRDFPEGIKAALAWFNEEQPSDSRIAVVGGRPGFKQYVFYGDDLSNHVQYVARHEPHGGFFPISSCEEWIDAVNDGDYEYAVIGPDQRTQSTSPVEAEWTEAGGATKLVESDMTFVYRLDGELDTGGCSAAEKPDAGGATPAP